MNDSNIKERRKSTESELSGGSNLPNGDEGRLLSIHPIVLECVVLWTIVLPLQIVVDVKKNGWVIIGVLQGN